MVASPPVGTQCGEDVAAPVDKEVDLGLRDRDLRRQISDHDPCRADRRGKRLDRPDPPCCAGYRARVSACPSALTPGGAPLGT